MSQNQNNINDLKGILYPFLSKWYLFVIGFIISISIAKLYLRYQENIYTVFTTMHLKAYTNSYRTLGGLELFNNSNNIGDEIQLIKSFDMISKVIDNLDFDVSYYHKGDVRTQEYYKDSPFRVVLDTSSFQTAGVPFTFTFLGGNRYRIDAAIKQANVIDINRNTIEGVAKNKKISQELNFGEPFKDENLGFTIYLTNPNHYQGEGTFYFVVNNHSELANNYKHRLNISPLSKESNILKLFVSGPLVEKDIDFLNKVTEVYIQEELDEKNRIAINTISFIDEQLGKISDSLRVAEKQIQSFRTRKSVHNLEGGIEKAMEKLEDLETQKAELLMKAEYYQYVLKYIEDNKELKEIVAPSSIGIEDEILSGLVHDLIKLKTERARLSSNTSDKNAYIKDLDSKIKTITETLYENVNNILKVSNIPVKNINGRIAQIEKSLNGLPDQDRLWLDVQRKFNLNNHLYNFLLEKRAEAGITKASTKPDHEVVEKASWLNAYQIAPNVSYIYNVAIILGFLLPFSLIFAFQYFSDTILSKEDLLRKTKIPIIGMVGHNDSDSNLAVAEKPKSSLSEAFRSIRINLNYMVPDKDKKVIVISSSVSGEGKTFFSINLSTIIAFSGKKTILIGADMRKPKIYGDFGVQNDCGLSSYLSGSASLKEVIRNTTIPNFDLLTSGPVPPNPGELMESVKMNNLIDQLREVYDYIVIDTPPIGLVADGFPLMSISDLNIYIVRHKYSTYAMLDKINGFYSEKRIKNLSLVINDIKTKDAARYGYGGGYGYGSYGNGYYEDDANPQKFKKILSKLNILS